MPSPRTPYATTTDLAARWRNMPTDTATQTTAATMLGDASFWVRQWFPTETAQIDAGNSDGTGALILVCLMVKRALINLDMEGVSSSTDGMAGMTEQRSYINPQGDLYILDNERTLIQGGARMQAKSMTMATGSPGSSPWVYSGIDLPGPLPSIYPDADYALQFPWIVQGP